MTELGADEAIYCADAVHPEYQTEAAFGWSKTGSNLGGPITAVCRSENFHRALNFETFDTPFVEPTTVDGISAASCQDCGLHPDKRFIHVIWDNAAYHEEPDVRAFLTRPDYCIHHIQLLPNFPHLNPIEVDF